MRSRLYDGPMSKHPWLSALSAYRDRRMVTILFLGFSSGLPYALSFITLSVWFRELEMSRTQIGLFSIVGLPYALKLFWAPLIDRVPFPLLTRRLGQRRGWALASQIGLMASLVWLGSLDPQTELGLMAVAALVVVFMAASQDIVVDAYRIETLESAEQTIGGAMYQYGYRFGMLASGAGALFLSDHMAWSKVYTIEAALVLIGVATVLLIREPETERGVPLALDPLATRPQRALSWLKSTLVLPFLEFRNRPHWWVVLAFVVLYRFPDSFLAVMANVFYKDMGLTNTEIAAVSKTFGAGATIFGIFVGGLVVHRLGAMRGLLVCGFVQVFSNLMYVWMAQAGSSIPVFAMTIAVENISGGMGGTAFIGYMSTLCSPGYAGTQYAMLSALALSGRNVFSTITGIVADQVGWTWFFITSTAVGIPGLLILVWLMRNTPAESSEPVAP